MKKQINKVKIIVIDWDFAEHYDYGRILRNQTDKHHTLLQSAKMAHWCLLPINTAPVPNKN